MLSQKLYDANYDVDILNDRTQCKIKSNSLSLIWKRSKNWTVSFCIYLLKVKILTVSQEVLHQSQLLTKIPFACQVTATLPLIGHPDYKRKNWSPIKSLKEVEPCTAEWKMTRFICRGKRHYFLLQISIFKKKDQNQQRTFVGDEEELMSEDVKTKIKTTLMALIE